MLSVIVHVVMSATLLGVMVGASSSFCGNTPTVWRNDNGTCPSRAICADVFNHVRDWGNGTRCAEKRILNNCMCPGYTACPVNNDAHMIYASAKQQRYLCEPVCDVPYCSNVQVLHGSPTAITAEQQSPHFDRKTFYRLKCRCPRHHHPRQSPGIHRSVRIWRTQWNYLSANYITHYVCNTGAGENTEDICD